METTFTVAVTGDAIVNRRLSVHSEQKFLSLIEVLKGVDVPFTHLETVIHDYEGPEIYPAAEAGGTWMRSPGFVAEELKWAGFSMVSHASNHCMDYSYGGLSSTWRALDEAGIVHAGTGRNLGEAREAAYLDTPKGRVALVSMCSSFLGWARSGEATQELKGRPGLNPLRYHYVADAGTIEMLVKLATALGGWVLREGEEWLFNPPGLHNTIYRFEEGEGPGVTTMVDEEDAQGNLKSIENARRQADYVLVHLHNHEWDPEIGLSAPPKFVPPFARSCIDAGGDVFIAEGSHAPLRGIEIYKNKPIFYDPGDFFGMSNTVTRIPSEFYRRVRHFIQIPKWEARTADLFNARAALPPALYPPGGYYAGPVAGSVLAVCLFEQERKLTQLKLYPVTMTRGRPWSQSGLPLLAEGELAEKIIRHLAQLSIPFGTRIEFQDGLGLVGL